jgi:hypothetical protein
LYRLPGFLGDLAAIKKWGLLDCRNLNHGNSTMPDLAFYESWHTMIMQSLCARFGIPFQEAFL